MRTIVNPAESGEPDHPTERLSDRELANVSRGKGKVEPRPLVVVKQYDKASPVLI